MVFLPDNKQTLMSRLEKKGLGKSTIPGFIWSLKRCLLDNPDMNHLQASERLQENWGIQGLKDLGIGSKLEN